MGLKEKRKETGDCLASSNVCNLSLLLGVCPAQPTHGSALYLFFFLFYFFLILFYF